jgi:hypothetical protein
VEVRGSGVKVRFPRTKILDPPFGREKCQRRDTGQKPIRAPLCMKGATTHTTLHQIGPNLASNYADFISYPSMCSDLDKSPCVQIDRTKSTRRAPVP